MPTQDSRVTQWIAKIQTSLSKFRSKVEFQILLQNVWKFGLKCFQQERTIDDSSIQASKLIYKKDLNIKDIRNSHCHHLQTVQEESGRKIWERSGTFLWSSEPKVQIEPPSNCQQSSEQFERLECICYPVPAHKFSRECMLPVVSWQSRSPPIRCLLPRFRCGQIFRSVKFIHSHGSLANVKV